jgi:hypothetical protein
MKAQFSLEKTISKASNISTDKVPRHINSVQKTYEKQKDIKPLRV